MTTYLAGDFASSPAQWVLTVTTMLTVALLAWIARTLLKLTLATQRLTDAVFPERKDSLPDQVEQIRDDVSAVRTNGSDKLREILDETKLARVEAAQAVQRVREREQQQDRRVAGGRRKRRQP